MAKHIGQMLISYELLAQMMKIDRNDFKITAVVPQTAEDLVNDRFRVVVLGPHAPFTPDGGAAAAIQWYDPYRHFEQS